MHTQDVLATMMPRSLIPITIRSHTILMWLTYCGSLIKNVGEQQQQYHSLEEIDSLFETHSRKARVSYSPGPLKLAGIQYLAKGHFSMVDGC